MTGEFDLRTIDDESIERLLEACDKSHHANTIAVDLWIALKIEKLQRDAALPGRLRDCDLVHATAPAMPGRDQAPQYRKQ